MRREPRRGETGRVHLVDATEWTDDQARMLCAYLGTALIATGQPVTDIQDDLAEVCTHLGYPGAQISASPTSIVLALRSGSPATVEVLDGPLRLDQAAEVGAIRRDLLEDRLTPAQALAELQGLRAIPPRYPAWLARVSWILIAVGICLILQPGAVNTLLALAGGILVLGLTILASRFRLVRTLLPTLAAFGVSLLVFSAASAGWVDGPLRTLLPPLAVLLPGALLVTGMAELTAGDMVAGASRLVFGGVQLLLFTLGIVAAARLLNTDPSLLSNVRVDELGWWAAPVGLVVICFGVCWMESVPLRLIPWIALVLGLAFTAQVVGQGIGGAAAGGFVGAVAASLGSSGVEMLRPRLPRLVLFLPAFWLLVPGSLGLISATQLSTDPSEALATALNAVTVIVAMVLGLLVGSATAQAVRRLVVRRAASLGPLR